MKMLIISINLIFVILVDSLDPPGICSDPNPFRLNDHSCGKFEDVCIKKEDVQCIQLLDSCKQCPPNNITITILQQILKFSKSMMENKFNYTTVPSNTSQPLLGYNINGIFVTFILIIIILILLIVEVRFKIITKLFQKCCKKAKLFQKCCKKDYNYDILLSRKDIKAQKFNETIEATFGNLLKNINERLDKLESEAINAQIPSFKFILNEQEQRAKLKKLCYNGRILENNECSLNNRKSSVNCYVDFTINVKDIIVVNLKGEDILPTALEIGINTTFNEFKRILKQNYRLDDVAIFKVKNDNQGLIQMKVGDSFVDGESLTVIKREIVIYVIKFILSGQTNNDKTYANTDLVSQMSPKKDCDFLLFHNKTKLNPNKFIFECKIKSGSTLDCYVFEKQSDFDVSDEPIDSNGIFMLHEIKTDNQKALLKKYSNDDWQNDVFIINELKAFQVTKDNGRFVQLSDTFLNDNSLFISMEYMANGTLRTYVKNPGTSPAKVSKWCNQILRGLKFLHDKDIIHRDLNPSNIFLDGNLDLKLSSSDLSTFETTSGPASVIEKVKDCMKLKLRYMAPEILNCQTYGKECDIWSFGMVLIKIITGKKPYPYKSKKDAIDIIRNENKFKFDHNLIQTSLGSYKSDIESCLKFSPGQRASIETLL